MYPVRAVRIRIPRLFCLLLLAPSALAARSDSFLIRCGWDSAGSEAAERDDVDAWGAILPDTVFRTDRDHGHVGGHPGRVDRIRVRGGQPDWPATWREGDVKYVFRLARGEYQVDLAFVETDVAAPGLRVFDVLAEDETALSALDIFDEAGDFTWLTRSFFVAVRDGWLDLRFVGTTERRPPRISRIAVRPRESVDGPPPPEPAPRIHGRAGVGQNLLWWPPVGSTGVAGYGVFRAATENGPFESVHARPLRIPFFVDRDVEGGRGYHYRLRTYRVSGSQSALSAPLDLVPDPAGPPHMKQYDVRVEPEAWKRLAARGDTSAMVAGELVYYDQRYPAEFRLDTRDAAWQCRKTFVVDMSRDPYRVFRKRRVLVLDAVAGDFTQLREKLSSEAARFLGLAAPIVEPVNLYLNGELRGLRFDVERLGDRFRRRAGLDREGVMIRLDGDDRWRGNWEARGRRVGRGGDVTALNYLIRRLNRIHEGEVGRFFEQEFYLRRVVDRLALGAVRGEVDAPPESYYFLKDSRNGRWEFFRQEHRRRDWGIEDFRLDVEELSGEALERVVFPRVLRPGRPARGGWMVLVTRLLKLPDIRRRYFERIEEIIDGVLSPEMFDGLVTRVHAEIRDSALRDPRLWPFDQGESFQSGPEKLREGHRRRLAALRGLIEAERRRAPEAVVFDAFLLRPASGSAWVSLANLSGADIDLADYRLSETFESAGRSLRDLGTLGAGRTARVPLPGAGPLGARDAGGVLTLWRGGGRTPVLADFVYYGHQSEGIAYGRTSPDGKSWAFYRVTDADERERKPLAAPSWEFVQGVERAPSGDLTIWFKPLGESRSPESLAHVLLKYRETGAEADGGTGQGFGEVRLVWDEQKFRYSLNLEKDDGRPRTAYYFLARTPDGVERAYPLGAPEPTYFIPVLPRIYINELCPRPLRGPDSPGEFIELYNAEDRPVSLRDMYLTDTKRVPTKWRIMDDIIVQPKRYIVFFADGLDRGRHADFKLKNSGEYLGLYGPVFEGNLRIDAIAYRGVPPGYSWGRKEDGTRGFRAWSDPTPGKRNLPKIPESLLRNGKARAGNAESGRTAENGETNPDN